MLKYYGDVNIAKEIAPDIKILMFVLMVSILLLLIIIFIYKKKKIKL